MRFTSAYYLLLLYGLGIFKQLEPIAADALSHIFAEAIHLATVHAKYGNHHLGSELETAARDNNKNNNTILQQANFAVHISTNDCRYHFYSPAQYKNHPFLATPDIEDIIICTQTPPPKFS
jgi:hypothetical protein